MFSHSKNWSNARFSTDPTPQNNAAGSMHGNVGREAEQFRPCSVGRFSMEVDTECGRTANKAEPWHPSRA